jgi:hypothetical protein
VSLTLVGTAYAVEPNAPEAIVSAPGGIQAGDIVLWFAAAEQASGWSAPITNLGAPLSSSGNVSLTSGTNSAIAGYDTIGSPVPTSWTFEQLGTTCKMAASVAVYRGASITPDWSSGTIQSNSTGAAGTTTTTSGTTLVAGSVLVGMAASTGTTSTWTPPSSPGGFTERLDSGATMPITVATYPTVSAGATGSVTFTESVSGTRKFSVLFSVASSSGATVTKSSGLGDNLYVAGYDLSGDVGSLSRIGGGPALLEVTAINASAMERLGGIRDGAIEFTAFHNTAASREHIALSPLPTTDALVTYARGTTLGNPAACCLAKEVGYDPTRAADGMLTFNTSAQANGYGLEWGDQLTAGLRTDTAGTNGTGVDGTASTSFGWQAYLQVTGFTGTSVTVTLEDSADNVSFASFTGSAFAAASAIGAQRISSTSRTATVRRYVRAVTSGTFSSATFNVVFVRNQTAVTDG